MRLKSIEQSYLNVSNNLYSSEFINLANIVNDKVNFDENTLFLEDDVKERLNEDSIKASAEAVYIIERLGKYCLICNTPIEEYKKRNVKSHELVLPNEIQGMMGNLYGYNSEVAPVLLAHQEKIDLKQIVNSDVEHELVKVQDLNISIYKGESAAKVLSLYEKVSELFVADGHHRLYTTSLSKLKDNMLSCVIGFDDLDILPIYRIIKGIDLDKFQRVRKFIENKFGCGNNLDELNKGEIRLTYRNQKFTVNLIDLDSDAFWNNDIYRLNTQIISQAFRIFNDENIDFISADDKRVTNLNEDEVLIEMASVSKQEFIEITQKDNILPPKSTWFTPKFPSFLVMSKYK